MRLDAHTLIDPTDIPFTPFHMGPGLLFKAAGGDRFSLVAFGVAQVAMDIEPLLGIIYRWPVLHGWTHTVVGAVGIAAVLYPLTVPAVQRLPQLCGRRWWTAFASDDVRNPPCSAADGQEAQRTRRLAVATGLFLGTLSHIVFDGIMHRDMRPLRPLSDNNPLLGLTSTGWLHIACLIAGLLGATAWLLTRDLLRAERR